MKFAVLTTAVAFFGAAAAAPFLRQEPNVVQRDVHVLGVTYIPRDVGGLPSPQSVQVAKDKREDVDLALRDDHDGDDDLAKRDSDKVIPKLINRRVGGRITPKIINREPAAAPQDIPEEDPVKSDNGNVVPYDKRQNLIPAEQPVKSEKGQITTYPKRQDVTIPAEDPVKSVNGQLSKYPKRQDVTIPAEDPVKSVNGQLSKYPKRQDVTIPVEEAVKSENGNIERY